MTQLISKTNRLLIAASEKRKNKELAYDVRNYILVFDRFPGGANDEVNRVLNTLTVTHLTSLGLEREKYIPLKRGYIRERNEVYRKDDRANFELSWGKITSPIDVELLVQYAQDNPRLIADIQSGKNIKEALWQQYQRRIQEEDSIHISTLEGFVTDLAEQHTNCHVFVVLFDHKVVSPSVEEGGAFRYASAGRGMCCWVDAYKISSRFRWGRAGICLSVHVVHEQDIETKENFVREMVNHLWAGHIFFGLKDHYDKPLRSCVMARPKNMDELLSDLREYHEIEDNRGLYLCADCERAILA